MVKRSPYKIPYKFFSGKNQTANLAVFKRKLIKMKKQINNLQKENNEIKEILYNLEKFLIMKESKNYFNSSRDNHLLYLIRNSLKTP